MPPNSPDPPKLPETGSSGFLNRILDTAKAVVTVSDGLDRLAKEDIRIQGQILELTKMVFELSKQVSDVSGQMKSIEKRLEDKDALARTTIELEVLKVTEKLRAELRGASSC